MDKKIARKLGAIRKAGGVGLDDTETGFTVMLKDDKGVEVVGPGVDASFNTVAAASRVLAEHGVQV